MKPILIRIDKAGRVVFPKNIRDQLAIKAGDWLKLSIHGNEVTLRPIRERSCFIKRGHALVFSSGGTELLDNETVETIRAKEHEDVLNRLTSFPIVF